MIAAVYTEGEGFAIRDVPIPEIGPDDLLIRVGACSICGTDVRTIRNGQRKLKAGQSVVLGHEFAGTIERMGERVQGYTSGMRVGVAPNIGCGRCDLCARGLPNMCPDYTAFGINIDGAHAEYVRVPGACIAQGSVVVLPETLPFAEACLIEPLSCAVSGNRTVNISFGESVLVFGAGPIGLMHLFLARLRGAGLVVMADPEAERLALARASGADEVIDPTSEDVRERGMSLTAGRGMDAVITACSVPAVVHQAPGLMAPFGRLCVFGGMPKDRPEVAMDLNAIHYKNLVVTGMTGGCPGDFRAAAALMRAGRMDLTPVVSHHFPMTRMQQAYDTALGGACMKVVITNNE